MIYPIDSVMPVTAALREHCVAVRPDGTPLSRLNALPSFDYFTNAVGIDEIVALEKKFSPEANASSSHE